MHRQFNAASRASLATLSLVLTACSTCEPYVRGDRTLNVNAVKTTIGKALPVDIGRIEFGTKFPTVTETSVRIDQAQLALCQQIEKLPEGDLKTRRRDEYIGILRDMLIDAAKSNPAAVRTSASPTTATSSSTPAPATRKIVRRIDQPVVNQPTWTTDVELIAGDSMTLQAGGCVQTGGSGKTWKRYVDPDPANNYYGSVEIQGVLAKTRLSEVVGRTISVPAGVAPVKIVLHYADDNYQDNGYWGRDDGTRDQCKGQPNAYVEVAIQRQGPAPQ